MKAAAVLALLATVPTRPATGPLGWSGRRTRLASATVWAAAVVFLLAAGVCSAAQPTYQRFYAGGARYPTALVSGPDGAVWFTWEHGLGRVALDGTVELHPIKGAGELEGLTAGPDHALWFVEPFAHRVGRFIPGGSVRLMHVNDGTEGRLGDIATGPDGSLWLVNLAAGRIERLAFDGTATVAAQLAPDASGHAPDPWTVAPAANGDVWFGGGTTGIGRLTRQDQIQVVAPDAETIDVQALAAAPDGTAWAAEFNLNYGTVIHVGSAGVLAQFPAALPQTLTIAPDGAPWFGSLSRITRVDPLTLRRQAYDDPFGTTSDCGEYAGQDVFPHGMAFSRDGALWSGDFGNGALLRVGPDGHATSPLRTVLRNDAKSRGAHYLARAPNGTVWVAANHALIALQPHRRRRTFPIGGRVGSLAVGADGRPWYSRGGVIGELTPQGTEQIIAHTQSRLIAAMTPAPGGEMWIADTSGRRIGRVSRSGAARYLTDRLPRKTHVIDLAAGAGGSVWATDNSGAILRISRDGVLRRFALRHGADPVALTRGHDHAYWFSEFNGKRVGRISARGRVREFKIHDQPTAIAAGSDGALWVLTAGGSGSDGLERVTTSGKVQRFYVRQTCTGAVHGLLSAPDGSLLLTEHGGPAAVVRLDVRALSRTHQFTSG